MYPLPPQPLGLRWNFTTFCYRSLSLYLHSAYLPTGYLWSHICCGRLPFTFLFATFLRWRWNHRLFTGQVRLLCGNGGHCLSILHWNDKHVIPQHRRMCSGLTCLLDPKLATSDAGHIRTRLSATCRLVVSW